MALRRTESTRWESPRSLPVGLLSASRSGCIEVGQTSATMNVPSSLERSYGGRGRRSPWADLLVVFVLCLLAWVNVYDAAAST